MEVRFRLTRMRVAILVLVAAGVGAGVTYAAIPDSSGVYTACMLNKVGTIRIIDPATQHCSAALESQITFNAKGQKGDPGTNGTNGTNGTDGASVSSVAEPAGANCANGGTKFTSANGNITYACNGVDGKDGTAGGSGAPWHIIRRVLNVPVGGLQFVTEQCPTGAFVLGGMFLEEAGFQTVYTSHVSTTVPRSWEYSINNSNGADPALGINTITFCGQS